MKEGYGASNRPHLRDEKLMLIPSTMNYTNTLRLQKMSNVFFTPIIKSLIVHYQ